MNLADIHTRLSNNDKEAIIFAWWGLYNDTITVGQIPFLNKEMTVKALILAHHQWGSRNDFHAVTKKLGTEILEINIKAEMVDSDVLIDGVKTATQRMYAWTEARVINENGIEEVIEI